MICKDLCAESVQGYALTDLKHYINFTKTQPVQYMEQLMYINVVRYCLNEGPQYALLNSPALFYF